MNWEAKSWGLSNDKDAGGGSGAGAAGGDNDKPEENGLNERNETALNWLASTWAVSDALVKQVPKSQPERQRLDDWADVLGAFMESDPQVIAVTRRMPSIKDQKLLPGQHPGVTATLGNKSGDVARLNAYGGMRDSDTPFELRDTKPQDVGTGLHAGRTDIVLSQPTQLNWHVTDQQNNMQAEGWITNQLNNSFRLANARTGSDEWIDAHPVVTVKNKAFKYLQGQITKALGKIVSRT